MLTPKQVEELIGLIDVHVDTFIGNRIGVDFLTEEQKKRLVANGIKLNPRMTIDTAFRLGMLSDMIGRKAQTMTYEQMLKQLKAKNYLPLSFSERKAVDRLRFQAYNEIRGLGNKIKKETGQVFIEADQKQRAKMEGIIRNTAEEAILNRLSAQEMKSLLGHRTKDWARDFDRISDYILHDAHDHGRAAHIERMDGAEARVFKTVFDQACPTCVRLYLTNGPGSEPRTFTISEIRANGNNIGRKVADMKPVLGGTHPWCRCETDRVPKGAKWDAERGEFIIQLTERQQRIADLVQIREVPE